LLQLLPQAVRQDTDSAFRLNLPPLYLHNLCNETAPIELTLSILITADD
jgi:hypothetical protein